MQRCDLLGLQELEPEEIRSVLEQARAFKEILSRRIKKVPALRGQSIWLPSSASCVRFSTSYRGKINVLGA